MMKMICPTCQEIVDSGVVKPDGTHHFKCHSTSHYQKRLAIFMQAFPSVGKLAREKLCKTNFNDHVGMPFVVVRFCWETDMYDMLSFFKKEELDEFLASCDTCLYSIAKGDVYHNGKPIPFSLGEKKDGL